MADEASQYEVTQLIHKAGTDRAAADRLLELVYDQLRKIAQLRMAEERRDHTLQATALVHEAYVRLMGEQEVRWDGRGHFFAAAAEAMRRILIEHARGRAREKRGGPADRARKRLPLNLVNLACEENPDEILMLDDAIRRMEQEDPAAGQVVRLRFFAGLSIDETAAALGVSPSVVDRDWAYARARLYRFLQ
jgi:RNA polymerase sigma factor (TIGR02999 family)